MTARIMTAWPTEVSSALSSQRGAVTVPIYVNQFGAERLGSLLGSTGVAGGWSPADSAFGRESLSLLSRVM